MEKEPNRHHSGMPNQEDLLSFDEAAKAWYNRDQELSFSPDEITMQEGNTIQINQAPESINESGMNA